MTHFLLRVGASDHVTVLRDGVADLVPIAQLEVNDTVVDPGTGEPRRLRPTLYQFSAIDLAPGARYLANGRWWKVDGGRGWPLKDAVHPFGETAEDVGPCELRTLREVTMLTDCPVTRRLPGGSVR